MPKIEANSHAFDFVEEESVIEFDGHSYRVKYVDERVVGQTPIKVVTAPHIFFDIVDEYRYTTLTNGFKSIAQVLAFIFDGTDWTFSVIDSFDTVEFENFGNANCLDLFSKVLERYGAEYDINGNDIIIREKIGSVIDLQFRYNHNVKTFKKSLDTTNLSTYIRGTGKRNEDGSYVVEAEYTSPNAAIFGIKHAPPYSNESITHLATLERNIKRALQDVPELSIELEFVVLKDAGYTKDKPGLGDTVPTIYEPIGELNLDLRVMEIEEYPMSNKAPKVTLATLRKSLAKANFSYQKALLDKLYDENSGKLRYNVLDDAVKRATEALNNSLTELEYPVGMGIIARDPNDPNRFVALRSSGLGITTDGGLTFKEAITSDGVTTSLLTAGQIKTNNVQIIGNDDLFYWDGNALMAINSADKSKYVRLNSDGLFIAKGAMTIERPDGFRVVSDGVLQHSFNIQGSTPDFQTTGVEKFGSWYRVATDNRFENVQRFTFPHTSRYLKVICNMSVDNNITGYITFDVYKDSDENISVATGSVTETRKGDGYRKEIVLDLGVPTGDLLNAYWRQYGAVSGWYVYGNVRYIVQEG